MTRQKGQRFSIATRRLSRALVAASTRPEPSFDEDQIVELTAVNAWENASSKFNHALGVPSQHLWRR
jgi:alkylhydroperoxidase family enzyme